MGGIDAHGWLLHPGVSDRPGVGVWHLRPYAIYTLHIIEKPVIRYLTPCRYLAHHHLIALESVSLWDQHSIDQTAEKGIWLPKQIPALHRKSTPEFVSSLLRDPHLDRVISKRVSKPNGYPSSPTEVITPLSRPMSRICVTWIYSLFDWFIESSLSPYLM